MSGVLAAAVKEAPERMFLDVSGIQYSYADIDSASTCLANGLLALGVKQGDRVGTLLDTSVEAILIWFAANKIGAVYASVNAAYKGEYLRHQFADAGLAGVCVAPDYADRLPLLKDERARNHTRLHRGHEPSAA